MLVFAFFFSEGLSVHNVLGGGRLLPLILKEEFTHAI